MGPRCCIITEQEADDLFGIKQYKSNDIFWHSRTSGAGYVLRACSNIGVWVFKAAQTNKMFHTLKQVKFSVTTRRGMKQR